jgi:ISXO2-like transposase domain/Transposase zinc-ribbon domain
MFEGFNIRKFINAFDTDAKCHEYLFAIKWKNGFSCKKCTHTTYCKTRDYRVIKCTNCKTKHSTTANTLFHNIKFSIVDAFLITFLVATDKKGVSSLELNRRLGRRAKTCYYFKRKVMKSMHSSGTVKLTGVVEIDESFVGGMEKGKPGRSKGKKKIFIMAVQVDKNNVQRMYAKQITACSTEQFIPFFETYIDKSAHVKTDKWRSYNAIKINYPNLVQEKSEPTKNFNIFHREVMMFKSALRGIYQSVTHLQDYLDEYLYRKNNCNSLRNFHNTICRMINHPQVYIKNLNNLG